MLSQEILMTRRFEAAREFLFDGFRFDLQLFAETYNIRAGESHRKRESGSVGTPYTTLC